MTPSIDKFSLNLDEKERIAALITRLGHPSAITLLDQHYQIFTLPSIEGFIGYRIESHCAVVISDPVCAEKDIPALALAFHDYCKQNNWKIIYIIVSELFKNWALKNNYQASLEIAEELIIDPINDPSKGRKGEKLRCKIHKATEANISIHEYLENDIELENQMQLAGNHWINSRTGPQIYLANMDLFSIRFGKRYFYAKDNNNKIMGVLLLNRVEKYNGWVLNMSMAMPEAPKGTSEDLIMSVIEKLRAENCRFFCIGAGSTDFIKEVIGFNSFVTLIAKGCFRFANWFFHLHARKSFLKKFQPKELPAYMVFSSSKIGYNEIKALKRSLNISL